MIKNMKYIIPIIVALIGAATTIAVQYIDRIQYPAITGRIVNPRSGETVPRGFSVSGELANIPQGEHVWLAVEIQNTLWIKQPEIPATDGRWIRSIYEGGSPPDGIFTLSLIRVPSEGQLFIEEWLKDCSKNDECLGVDAIPGAKRLDLVESLRLKNH